MPALAISLDQAKSDKLFYFVANVVVYRESDGRCLLLKRSDREKVHPGKYCVPGGKLEWSQLDLDHPTRRNGDVLDYEDTVEELLTRETLEEAGVVIEKKLSYINSVAFVRPDGIPVVLVKFAAKYVSGEVKIEDGSFTAFTWADPAEAASLNCIDGIANEVAETCRLFARQPA